MFDIDAGYAPIIRLDERYTIVGEKLELAEKELELASARWLEAKAAYDAVYAQSRPIPISTNWMSNDFWDHRHRVMAGTTPMIARSAGHIDRMTAAAAGEIEDPTAGLRRERN